MPAGVTRGAPTVPVATVQNRAETAPAAAEPGAERPRFDDGFETGDINRFKTFLGEVAEGSGVEMGGQDWAKLYGGSKNPQVQQHVKKAKEAVDQWVKDNPNATPEQVQAKIAEVKKKFGDGVMFDKMMLNYVTQKLTELLQKNPLAEK